MKLHLLPAAMPPKPSAPLSAKDLAVTRSLYHWWLTAALWLLIVGLYYAAELGAQAVRVGPGKFFAGLVLAGPLLWLYVLLVSVPWALALLPLQLRLYRAGPAWPRGRRWAWLLGGLTLIHALAVLVLALWATLSLPHDLPPGLAPSWDVVAVLGEWVQEPYRVLFYGSWWLASLAGAAWLNRSLLRPSYPAPALP